MSPHTPPPEAEQPERDEAIAAAREAIDQWVDPEFGDVGAMNADRLLSIVFAAMRGPVRRQATEDAAAAIDEEPRSECSRVYDRCAAIARDAGQA